MIFMLIPAVLQYLKSAITPTACHYHGCDPAKGCSQRHSRVPCATGCSLTHIKSEWPRMQDPVRQTMLARMGIQGWQLRRPALPGTEPVHEAAHNPVRPQATAAPLPTGKLWLLAPGLPAETLLADICQLLGITPDEVSLLGELPPAELQKGDASPLLWLTQTNPERPDALICPLAPDAAQKRALWQQLRQHQMASGA